MPCYYPVGNYRNDGSPAFRPCGQCLGCRLELARTWAVRCVHEASLHKENSFITLTYNNKNLPEDGCVSKVELQKFMKRLRRYVEPKKIRFFGCGEYGSLNSRPHYHLCLFGHDFNDKELVATGARTRWRGVVKSKGNDHDLYISKVLQDRIWKKGFCSVGKLTMESAGYTARYVTKKITGKNAKDHYQGKCPEFAMMSRSPGIGSDWIEKYMSDVYPKDFHTINGIKHRPCRFYDERLKKWKPIMYNDVKKKREDYADKKDFESSMRGFHRERYRRAITKRLKRRLEND